MSKYDFLEDDNLIDITLMRKLNCIINKIKQNMNLIKRELKVIDKLNNEVYVDKFLLKNTYDELHILAKDTYILLNNYKEIFGVRVMGCAVNYKTINKLKEDDNEI